MISNLMGRFALAGMFLLAGCLGDDGVVDPAAPPKPFLGQYHGHSLNEGDSALSSNRLLHLDNPQVSLVWRFLGPKEYVITPSQGSVNTNRPFLFDLKLSEPPSPEVLDNPDLAIGVVWLFSDRNGNGVLDRLIHPEMMAAARSIDSLYGIYHAALKRLADQNDLKTQRVEVVEVYHVGKFGTVTMGPPGDEDTLFVGRSPADTAIWENTFTSRFRALMYENRWERFFALRKRSNDYYRVTRVSGDYVYEVTMPYNRKLFPKPNGQHQFERDLRAVGLAYDDYIHGAQNLLTAQVLKGHNQYPYSGFDEPGADWVAGQGRNCFIVYLRDNQALQELRDAEKTSSFLVKGIEKVQVGYNAIHCDDQYICEILGPEDDLTIDLGQSDEYFNPPSSPPRKPIANFIPAEVGASRLARLAGEYQLQPYRDVRIAARDGSLWAEIPDEGLWRLAASDSLLYYSPVRDLQLQFVEDASGRVYKLFVFLGRKKYVAAREKGDVPAQLDEKVQGMLAPPGPLDKARAALFAASTYAYGKDTLKAVWTGDSLRVSFPGLLPMALVPRDSLSFFSRQTDLRVDFELDDRGRCAGAWIVRPGGTVLAPALDYTAPAPDELFPGLPDSLLRVASEHSGTGRDTFATLDGKTRYLPGADRLFLLPGDGWLVAMVRTGSADSLSLHQGGDYLLFRVPGLEGKAMALEITLCPQRGVKGRVRLRARGGKDPGVQEDLLGGDQWAELDGKPKTIRLGPWKASTDPYYVRIAQLPTADQPFLYSFDSYRVLAE